MENVAKAKEEIKDMMNDVDWANPYWLDEVKEEFSSTIIKIISNTTNKFAMGSKLIRIKSIHACHFQFSKIF